MFNSKFHPLRIMSGATGMDIYNGKGGDAPAPPDYAAAAAATSAGNLEAAKYTTAANRINQITPYGNLTYTRTPQIDQAGYDAAMKAYQDQLANYNQSIQNQSPYTSALNAAFGGYGKGGQNANNMVMPTAPKLSDYTNGESWTATQTLTPAQQDILNKQQGLSSGLLGAAQSGLDYAKGVIEKPGIDMSTLPSYGINPGETYSDAIMRRLQPTMEASQEAFDAKMANQGIAPGTKAYENANREFQQKQNDLLTSAQIQGMQTGLGAQQQAFQQAAYNQMQPINVINALRTGSQVQNPNYVNSAQMQNPGGADLLGAAQNTYNAQLQNYNAQQASNQGFMGGLMGLGSLGLGAYNAGLFGGGNGGMIWGLR